MSKFFQSRLAVAAAASVAVVALMAASVATVQAAVAQDQEENEKAKQSEEELPRARALEHRVLMESKLDSAKALHEALERGAQERLNLVREYGRGPRVELRRLRGNFGRSLADRVLGMGDEIELTEQQEARVRDARRTQRRAEIERDAQIEILGLDLDELLENRHTADLDSVEELMQRRAGLRVQGQVAEMRASQEVWNALTPEQQEKLEADRHGIFMTREGRPHSLFFDGEGMDFVFDDGDLDFGELEFGKLFNELHLDGLEGLLELQSEDGAPFIWRYERKSDDDDADGDGSDKDEDSTVGTAIGISWGGRTIRTMNY